MVVSWLTLGSVNAVTVFEPLSSIVNIFAGVGKFNASLSLSQNGTQAEQALIFAQSYMTLFADETQCVQLQKSENCPSDRSCSSFYFPGDLTSAGTSSQLVAEEKGRDIIVIRNSPTLQVDFWEMSVDEPVFTTDDCVILGNAAAALVICLRKSNVTDGALVGGISNDQCAH